MRGYLSLPGTKMTYLMSREKLQIINFIMELFDLKEKFKSAKLKEFEMRRYL